MRRGDLIIVAMQGDFGKPRPAVVLQTNARFSTSHVIERLAFILGLAD